ncbi:unnamed protein product [Heligmosomoides polygyrus]|uniref:Uncharacterized protein n=1 Tax=Heligmosomoides polygyrus TaxID=6339 RepID=A0A183F2S8_HELPZ|nr:unnamed protein product [Heligmosomoides polygyrus]
MSRNGLSLAVVMSRAWEGYLIEKSSKEDPEGRGGITWKKGPGGGTGWGTNKKGAVRDSIQRTRNLP